jgi:imidazolonepropionase-like amidohydrolase
MKQLLRAILAWVFFCALGVPQPLAQTSSSVLIIHDVTVIDATGAPAQAHRTVVVRNGKIEAIGGAVDEHSPGTHVNGAGKFLIPGLWDMHTHIVFGDWFPRGKEVTLPLFIANGITGVRDMGGELEVLQQWRKEISAGT